MRRREDLNSSADGHNASDSQPVLTDAEPLPDVQSEWHCVTDQADPVTGLPEFDKDCLAAPADAEFKIALDNGAAEWHNIDILDHPGGTSLFTGKIFAGPKTMNYAIDPLSAGTYYFRCAVHPLRMNGTLLVGD